MTAIAEAPRCRLYLTTPPELVSGGVHLRDFLGVFEPALAADIACLLIDAPREADDDAVAAVTRPLAEIAQPRGIATLIAERAALATQLDLDGVHLDLTARDESEALRHYRETRKFIGGDAIVGTLCTAERHMAMEIAEADADYVGFRVEGSEGCDLVAWWAEMMNTPCVAFGDFDATTAGALAAAGADFVAPGQTIWGGPDPAAALAELQAAIRAG